ncbi:MAG: hypothetical protein HON57_07195 [Flavobacteriaceae bacterium]|nr:hypothetical protein [Candidatus Arcticimaribacter sp.]
MKMNFFSNTNIKEELIRTSTTPTEIVFSGNGIVWSESSAKEKLNQFEVDHLERDRIFHIDDIRKTCIDFRLRFLDSKYFKNKIPQAAFDEINRLNTLHNTRLGDYKIMAPSKLFKLENTDDPLLFAPIGNGYYYLIHKWGNDLHPFRKAMMWPFKSILNLAVLILFLSWFVTQLVPVGLFSKANDWGVYWMTYFFMFKGISAIVIFYGFALGKNFNPAIWNSKYNKS